MPSPTPGWISWDVYIVEMDLSIFMFQKPQTCWSAAKVDNLKQLFLDNLWTIISEMESTPKVLFKPKLLWITFAIIITRDI